MIQPTSRAALTGVSHKECHFVRWVMTLQMNFHHAPCMYGGTHTWQWDISIIGLIPHKADMLLINVDIPSRLPLFQPTLTLELKKRKKLAIYCCTRVNVIEKQMTMAAFR